MLSRFYALLHVTLYVDSLISSSYSPSSHTPSSSSAASLLFPTPVAIGSSFITLSSFIFMDFISHKEMAAAPDSAHCNVWTQAGTGRALMESLTIMEWECGRPASDASGCFFSSVGGGVCGVWLDFLLSWMKSIGSRNGKSKLSRRCGLLPDEHSFISLYRDKDSC